jgi:hypothetical protein
MFPLKNYLRDFYHLQDDEIYEFAQRIENEVYNSLKKEFSKNTKEIASTAVELFRKKFWYEKDNVARSWNRIENEEIDNLFKKCRSELIDLFETFKTLKIPKNPLDCKI